jgi:Protein of unknown function (DUF1453)
MEQHPAGPTTIVFLVLIPLLAWRMYSRFRRMVGRQRLSRARPWLSVVLFPLLIVALGAATLSRPEGFWVLAAGLIAGALLGVFGLTRTRFESTSEGLFYTPNVHLGMALSLLLVVRLAVRLVQVISADPQVVQHGTDGFAQSPFTLGVVGLLAGYYVAYAIGLLRWRFRVIAARPGS